MPTTSPKSTGILCSISKKQQRALADHMADNLIPITIENAGFQGVKDSLILSSLTSVCVELCVNRFGKKKTIKALKAILADM